MDHHTPFIPGNLTMTRRGIIMEMLCKTGDSCFLPEIILGVNTDGQFAETEATEKVVRIAYEKNNIWFLRLPS